MSGERQPQAGGVDVDDPALGVVDEHGLAEAEFAASACRDGAVGHHRAVAHDTERVAMPPVRPQKTSSTSRSFTRELKHGSDPDRAPPAREEDGAGTHRDDRAGGGQQGSGRDFGAGAGEVAADAAAPAHGATRAAGLLARHVGVASASVRNRLSALCPRSYRAMNPRSTSPCSSLLTIDLELAERRFEG